MGKTNKNNLLDATEGGIKLTRKWIHSLRCKIAKDADLVNMRLMASVIGEPVVITCECGKEHLAPSTGEPLSPSQVGAAKLMLNRYFPELTGDGVDQATEETRTFEQNVETMAKMMQLEALISGVAKNHPEAALKCRDMLDKLLSRVEPMKRTI